MSSAVPLSKRSTISSTKATGSVEPQPELALRTLVIKVRDVNPVFSRVSTVLSGDSMPQRRSVNLH
jgi:hypothetical protein